MNLLWIQSAYPLKPKPVTLTDKRIRRWRELQNRKRFEEIFSRPSPPLPRYVWRQT